MGRMINCHVNVFLESSPSTSGPIVKIWKFCEVSMCYLGYSILRFWYLAVCDEFSGQFGNMYMCQSEESMERGDERRGETAGQVWNLTKLNTKGKSELFK